MALSLEAKVENVELPSKSSPKEYNGIKVEEYYVAGYGGWGFNYVCGLYATAEDVGLSHDVLVMTPNRFGANRAAVLKVVKVERGEDCVIMDVQPMKKKDYNSILEKFGVPIQQET